MHPKPTQSKSAFLLSLILGIYLNRKCLNLIVIRGRETLMSVQTVHKARCRSETHEALRLLSGFLSAGVYIVHRGASFQVHHYK